MTYDTHCSNKIHANQTAFRMVKRAARNSFGILKDRIYSNEFICNKNYTSEDSVLFRSLG